MSQSSPLLSALSARVLRRLLLCLTIGAQLEKRSPAALKILLLVLLEIGLIICFPILVAARAVGPVVLLLSIAGAVAITAWQLIG